LRSLRWRRDRPQEASDARYGLLAAGAVAVGCVAQWFKRILGIVLATLGLVTIVVSTFIPEPPPQRALQTGLPARDEDSETYLCVENIEGRYGSKFKVWALLSPRIWESADDEGPTILAV